MAKHHGHRIYSCCCFGFNFLCKTFTSHAVKKKGNFHRQTIIQRVKTSSGLLTFPCILCLWQLMELWNWMVQNLTLKVWPHATPHNDKPTYAHLRTTRTDNSWKRPKEKESWVIRLGAVRFSPSLTTLRCVVWPCFKMLHFTCSDSPSLFLCLSEKVTL